MPENNLYSRLVELIRAENETSLSLAKTFNMQQPTVWNYLNGRTKISLEFIERILDKFPNVSAEWLMRGVGTMYNTENELDSYPIEVDETTQMQERIDKMLSIIERQQNTIENLTRQSDN